MMTLRLTAATLAGLLLAGTAAFGTGGDPMGAAQAPAYPKVRITMARGERIVIELYPDVAPRTVENFLALVRRGFYDGLTFHRVVPGFVVQGGDPNGDGTGGPGYAIKAEFNARKHVTGTVAMARAAHPDSAGSQFYICLAPQPSLDGKYTVFGQVIEGMDVVQRIRPGDVMQRVEAVSER
ncbi:MAG TPA: peptidylprolyl isomerase [Thermodesulfobacteriota bacterium]|nr:peptidylprolyl isomerase [Thermodesulfobacteriota bacterium]